MKTMCKRTLAFLLCALMLCGALPFATSAAEILSGNCGKDGDNVTWALDTETGTLTISGTGEMADYDWGDSPWYAARETIRTATIENGVTSIGELAFSDCDQLTSITIPDSVTSLGIAAFSCSGLRNVTIPDSITEISTQLFAVSSLQSVSLPNSIKVIGTGAFWSCSELQTVNIPDSVTEIGEEAFSNTGLTSVTIPANVANIGQDAFEYCRLTSVSVDSRNLYYCSDASGVLYNKDKTTLIQYPINNSRSAFTIPDGVTEIGESAFCAAENLVNITISDTVNMIGAWAFCRCTGLSGVTLPGSVTQIGDHAFEDCTALTEIKIPYGVTTIGNYAFCACSSLAAVILPKSVTLIGTGAFNAAGVVSITIPNSVTRIPEAAFYCCDTLTDIHIPASVTEIGEEAFHACHNLAYICSDTSDCYAKTYTEANGIEFRVCGGKHQLQQEPQSVPDVKAECDDAAFDVPVSLLAQSVAPSELTHEFPSYEFALTGESMEAVYLIRAVDENGDVVQPNAGHTVTLRIPIPAGKDYQKCRICHVVDAETARTESFKWNPRAGSAAKPFTVSEDGRYFIIEVTSFSPFIIFTLPTLKLGDTRKTLPYGEKRTLTADVENLPDGARIVWTVDNDRVTLTPSADGKTCVVSAQKNGKVTVTATVVDKDGKEIQQDGDTVSVSVTLQTKANFFHKLWYWVFRIPWPFG